MFTVLQGSSENREECVVCTADERVVVFRSMQCLQSCREALAHAHLQREAVQLQLLSHAFLCAGNVESYVQYNSL